MLSWLHRNANVGGICVSRDVSWLTDDDNPFEAMKPMFLNVLVPDPSFFINLPGPALHDPEAFRYWCYAKCTCTRPTAMGLSLIRDFLHLRIGERTLDIDLSQGGVSVTTKEPGTVPDVRVMIPKQGDGSQGQSNAECSAELTEACTSYSDQPFASAFSGVNPGTCGQPCQGSGECHSPKGVDPSEQCQCRVIEYPLPDPSSASPLAYCLTAATMMLWLMQNSRLSGSSLMGRSIEDQSLAGRSIEDRSLAGRSIEDRRIEGSALSDSSVRGTSLEAIDTVRSTEEARWGCLCNTTYASRSCCDSTTKFIWEEPHLRLSFRLLAFDKELEGLGL